MLCSSAAASRIFVAGYFAATATGTSWPGRSGQDRIGYEWASGGIEFILQQLYLVIKIDLSELSWDAVSDRGFSLISGYSPRYSGYSVGDFCQAKLRDTSIRLSVAPFRGVSGA